MKQHRFFVASDQIQGEVVSFSAEQWHQMRAVLRLRPGDSVRVFDGVEALDRVVELIGSAAGRVVELRRQAPEPRTRLVVYPALLQRDKFELVLQKLTEIGAASIVPLLTARGLVRERPDERRQTRWRAILREATEQSGRGRVPELADGLPFSEAITQASSEGLVLLAYEGEQQLSLRAALVGAQEALFGAQETARRTSAGRAASVSLFVGPEGGFAPEEVACARAAGAQVVTLGPRILRSDTASPLMAALVLYELGDLSCAHDDG